ncbi:hypothetical protein [Mesorhizobium sp.]|uniref:hypothetical protein n=1 Tax=Mesorhizobium sp. TaxID=1871066 RepID=UPI0025FE79FB|nr:hypothetical protein [Mesorhizobium sp.]
MTALRVISRFQPLRLMSFAPNNAVAGQLARGDRYLNMDHLREHKKESLRALAA